MTAHCNKPHLVQGLVVDCANGVGATHLVSLAQDLLDTAEFYMVAINLGEGTLNGGCGADFIQKERKWPQGFDEIPDGAR